MKWIQMLPVICPKCDEGHILFQVFFRRDGMIGLAVKCSCGMSVEHSVSWSDALEYAESQDKPSRKEQKEEKKKKPKGNT